MISHENQFIFIHTPKCAGTSIQQALGNQNISTTSTSNHHGRLIDYIDTYGYSICERYFKFSVVRNPWDLEVSSYFFNKNMIIVSSPKNFGEKVKMKVSKNFANRKNGGQKILNTYVDPYWQSLIEFCRAHSFEDYIESPFWFHKFSLIDFVDSDRNLKVDYIMKLETLQSDFDFVCKKIGMEIKKLPRKNSSNHRSYREYYSARTRKIVEDYYSREIEAFGYRF